jgi:hypothetical protein
MEALTSGRIPLAVTVARTLTRLLSWGMEPQRRADYISECDTDWELMSREFGSRRVLGRAVRGIPTAILGRMDDHDLTAIPASLVLVLIALATGGMGLMDRTYPLDVRRWIVVSAISLAIGSLVFVRDPRHIDLRRLRWPALALGIGVLGIAVNMPTATDWPYEYPYMDPVLSDTITVTGFVVIAIGCLMITLASVTVAHGRGLALGGGTVAVTGIVLFGTGQIVWGIIAAPVDLTITVTAIGAGLGSYALAHVLPRLRHLDVARRAQPPVRRLS